AVQALTPDLAGGSRSGLWPERRESLADRPERTGGVVATRTTRQVGLRRTTADGRAVLAGHPALAGTPELLGHVVGVGIERCDRLVASHGFEWPPTPRG